MSSGQKAWAEELEQQAWDERVKRLLALGPRGITNSVDEIKRQIDRLGAGLVTLPRAGWDALDKINAELNKLS